MSNDEKWFKWNKKTVLYTATIAVLFVAALFWFFGQGSQPVFEFDDGTTQGWTANGIFDDAGIMYGGSKVISVNHAEQHQYPDKFPCPPNCDPLNDKKGSLGLSLPHLQSTMPLINFPINNSNYWHVELVSPTLSNLFQNKSEFEAYIGDMYGVEPGHINALIVLMVDVGGTMQKIIPIGGIKQQLVSKDMWTKLSAKFTIPANGYIKNIMIQIKGDWQNYRLYEGGIFLDHVAAVK
jgi:hypothetical protein